MSASPKRAPKIPQRLIPKALRKPKRLCQNAAKQKVSRTKPVDEAEVARLAYQGCSVNEISLIIGLAEPSVHQRFSKMIAVQRARRRTRLREVQLSLAESGDRTMLIWLGKQELDQSDTPSPVVVQNFDALFFASPGQAESMLPADTVPAVPEDPAARPPIEAATPVGNADVPAVRQPAVSP